MLYLCGMKKIINWIISPFKMVNGKEMIEQSMSLKYGKDWLDQCTEGLKNPEVRTALRKDLNIPKS